MSLIDSYEERVVAFIDILGFKNLVYAANNNIMYRNSIKDIIEFIYREKEDNDKGILSLKEIGKEVSVFSDNIVISMNTNSEGAFFYTIMDAIHIQIELLAKGFFVRGGLTIGDIFHDGRIIFGPALIKAYELESEKANWARIIIDSDILEYGITKTAIKHNSINYELNFYKKVLIEDEDRVIYTNFLGLYDEFDDYTYYLEFKKNVKDKLLKDLNTNDSKIYNKVRAFINYYNKVDATLCKQYRDPIVL